MTDWRSPAERETLRADIARLAGEGLCGKDIAARLGVKRPSVHYQMKRLGLDYKSAAPRPIGEKRSVVLALAREGLGAKEIGAQLQISRKTVQDHLGRLREIGALPSARAYRPRDAGAADCGAAEEATDIAADARYRAQTRREAKACDALLDRLVALYGPPRFRGQPPAWAMRRADDGRACDAPGGQAGAGAA